MKRFIGVALSVSLVVMLLLGSVALADDPPDGEGYWECWEEEGHWDYWDEEGHDECWDEVGHQEPDALFFDNDDFQFALGFDRETGGSGWTWSKVESHTGGMWSRPDGYDIYQDDGSGEGWLDKVSVQDGWMPSDYNSYWDDNAFYFSQESGTYYVMDEEAGCIYVIDKEAGSIWVVDKEGGRIWIPLPSAPTVSNGDPYDGFAGQFLVIMCGHSSHKGYNWVEGWKGKTLAKPVSQICHYCFNGFSAYFKLEIPEGTVVEGYYNSQRVQHLEFSIVEGEYCFSPANINFSQPVVLYQGIDGEWVEVLKFTQVLNGKAD